MGGALPSGMADSDAASAESAAKPTPWSLLALAVIAVIAVAAIIMTVGLVSGPRPDATLRPTFAEPDLELITLLESEGPYPGFASPPGFASEMLIDLSTLRSYETFHGFEVWSAVNAFESPCLIAVDRETVNVVARNCVPSGGELFIDADWYVVPEGEGVRFFLHGDTVDAYHLVAEEQD